RIAIRSRPAKPSSDDYRTLRVGVHKRVTCADDPRYHGSGKWACAIATRLCIARCDRAACGFAALTRSSNSRGRFAALRRRARRVVCAGARPRESLACNIDLVTMGELAPRAGFEP